MVYCLSDHVAQWKPLKAIRNLTSNLLRYYVQLLLALHKPEPKSDQ